MTKYMITNVEGFPKAFFAEDIHGKFGTSGCTIPTDAIQITNDQWQELQIYEGQRIWKNGKIEEHTPPTPEVGPDMIILPAVTLWERMTEAEAEQVAAAMETQSFRTRQIFNSASTYRSDHELWPLLEQMANQLFGEARAAELLAG
ncbi:hypothetical protein [Ochrobactrum chromiisoli]|uniref:Phage tail protein n=1 Tax=Ochrobactrum chromiisoli TaxID=2993941 RepID=A0ABT3QM95_9HYPH|nr:hypothetical protein [Ochrobactrum chromiisoli]MCX2696732.1 hypothetical protein [Ochrobactrum chromiisoli]